MINLKLISNMQIYKKVNIENKKAQYNYMLLDYYEAGIQLFGTEIKSIRMKKVNISESFCQFRNNALYVINMRIDDYQFGTSFNHNPTREKKLLLKKQELNKLLTKVKKNQLTIIPIRLYINNKGLAKLKIALVQGKKKYDKRQSIKEKDLKREMQRKLL